MPLPDSRQRAPFAHASSSADLTSPPFVPSHRPLTSVSGLWPRQSDDNYDGATYTLDTPPARRRSLTPTPSPFSLPTFAVPSYSTLRFVSLCALWYSCSAVSSNTGKVILNRFRYPVTLTIVQFAFVAGLCVVCSRRQLGWTGRLRSPTKPILRGTLPLAAFQVGGHIFGSLAMSRVPVSTVHTIKALSPLFTVFAYAALFGVSYSPATYISLLPLTLGVMLACSFDLTISNILGLVCAFGSTLVFVSQNIFFKKIMPTNSDTAGGAKLDKINLLYFSSSTAFILMIPVWLYSDAARLWVHFSAPRNADHVALYFFLNGTVHFAQNLLAFAILSSTSPVTYSIASLVKRIAVICLAIVWFKQPVHGVQAIGIALTGVGLLMYNNAKKDVEKGEKKMRQVEAVRDGILPTNKTDQRILDGLGLKDMHSSPKPVYIDNLANGPLSKSSAIRSAYNPPSNPKPVYTDDFTDASLSKSSAVRSAYIPPVNPYPSPPPSTTSSPPPSRHRRLSVETRNDDFRLPPLDVYRASTILEESGVTAGAS